MSRKDLTTIDMLKQAEDVLRKLERASASSSNIHSAGNIRAALYSCISLIESGAERKEHWKRVLMSRVEMAYNLMNEIARKVGGG